MAVERVMFMGLAGVVLRVRLVSLWFLGGARFGQNIL
jgi:hypothetical protein